MRPRRLPPAVRGRRAAMHIKQITISGFKSYRDATVAGPFSPGHNTVIGKNGSGKSNFFDAVRFVLSDTFSSLRAEERVALLHEGAGASVLSAYVEMVFDNSDGRLPFDKDEVSLRRMVGLKKDEYVLDRKNVPRTEVFNILESAGFSRSNPYYIVQQGKVAALCAMTDRQRLDLLKEVAGTRVYDERRDESLRIMEETDAKREKISEVVQYIETRLSELEGEKDELKAFQKLDKERRALQYTIHVKELDAAKERLEEIDGDRAEDSTRGDELHAQLRALQDRLARSDRDVKAMAPELKRLQDERRSVDADRKRAVDKIAKLQVNVSDAEQAAAGAMETVSAARAELTQLDALVATKHQELEPLEAQFATVKNQEDTIRKQLSEAESRILALRVKADRVNQFATAADRDAHLKKEKKNSKRLRDSYISQLGAARKDVERLQAAVERNTAKNAAKEQEIQELQSDASQATSELDDLRKERDAVHSQRQAAWREEAELDSKIKGLKSSMNRLEGAKRAVLGAGAHGAIAAVMRAAAKDPQNLGSRVYGPLVDLIEVDPKFSTAADVTAGSALTHVVVDSDSTAARLVRIMQAQRAGRVTFIPLNRLDRNIRPPPRSTTDAIPLVSKITADDHIRPAVAQVFGRTLVTRSVAVAAEMSREHGADCVTLEGDQVNKRGAMTGGFMDVTRSRLDATRALREARAELGEMEPKAAAVKATASEVDAGLSKVLGEIQRREAVARSAHAKVARLQAEIAQLKRYCSVDRDNVPKAMERITTLEQSVASTEQSMADNDAEIGSPMANGLSVDEQQSLADMKVELERLRTSLASTVISRSSVERSVSLLKSDLVGNLERRSAELQNIISTGGISEAMENDAGDANGADAGGVAAEALSKHREALQCAETELNVLLASLQALDGRLNEARSSNSALTAQMELDRDEEASVTKLLDEEKQRVEERYSQRSIQSQKKTDAEQSIRDLGSLPADFDKYRGLGMGSLMRKLKRANESLQDYSHVNKKALDQYISFTEQRETLHRRREELKTGATAIRQLIESLDQRKDEDILRTYKGVSKFFSQVFSELVPGGRASLVMLKSSANGDSTPVDSSSGRIQYTGVAMKVAFSSIGEAYLLQQLSGGQKSIVALALIFSIQRLDPAPFYLFDEIDANLDATHRQAVATLIRKQAGSGTQFITTTFRPEFVNAGDMWFGVTHKNKISAIEEVSREVALTFIVDEPTR